MNLRFCFSVCCMRYNRLVRAFCQENENLWVGTKAVDLKLNCWHMSPGKAGLQVFLPCLFNYSFPRSQQLTLKVDQKGFHANSYNSNQFPVTLAREFSSQMFNADMTTVAAIEQLMQKLSVNHYSILITIQASIFLNIKTLQV